MTSFACQNRKGLRRMIVMEVVVDGQIGRREDTEATS